MYLDILPLASGGARLARVYGDEPCVVLPESLPAANGGEIKITELGDYCFSPSPRCLPAPELLTRYEVSGDTAHIIPLDVAAEPHAVCGNFVEEITLPSSLRVIGSCAFYNCRALRSLSFGDGALAIGSDVFLNCFALETITLRAEPEAATGLFAVVNNISEAVRAVFAPRGAAKPLAAFWYPAYWEDIEETPAHILLHTFSGQGYHYRQCFAEGRLLPAEYDAIFPEGHSGEDAAVMAALAFERLRRPWRLGEGAERAYRDFLAANSSILLARLLKAQDIDSVRELLSLGVMNREALAEASAMASKADCAAIAAILADAEGQMHAAGRKKERYDFDF